MKTEEQKAEIRVFDQIWKRVKTKENLRITSTTIWGADTWMEEATQIIARLMDGGYYRVLTINEKWKVVDAYPAPLKFTGITAEEFAKYVNL